MAIDLQPEQNKLYRLFQQFSRESLAVGIALAALIVSILFSALAMVSMTKTSEYNAVIEQQNYRIESLSDSIDVYRIRAAKMNAYLAAHGVPTEEIYDEQ